MELANDEITLRLAPKIGGAVAAFDWRGRAVFRPALADRALQPTAQACFPMLPYVGRIGGGRFPWRGEDHRLPVNAPSIDAVNPIHGYGWLAPWGCEFTDQGAVMRFDYLGGDWPWAFRAEQTFRLSDDGYIHGVSLTNLADEPMPAGFGLHPYFPRNPETRLLARFTAEVIAPPDGLDAHDEAQDWWDGQPVSARVVDNAYAGREGPMRLVWPDRDIALSIIPSAGLPHATVFAPAGADFVCVEPISHLPDALNAAPLAIRQDLRALAPGETWTETVTFSVRGLTSGGL